LFLFGNYEGQHHHDVPMARLLPIVVKAKPQGLLFEAANPRHAHEWSRMDCGFGTNRA
jgi:5-methyltetrahydropteroyltriglutamate--homocysteine methyltransferase